MENNHEISFSGTENEDLIRTLMNLLNTRSGSQPADRDFGISWECLDEIPEVAENLFFLEVTRKVARYEPRVEVGKINFRYQDEKMIPHIYFQEKQEG